METTLVKTRAWLEDYCLGATALAAPLLAALRTRKVALEKFQPDAPAPFGVVITDAHRTLERVQQCLRTRTPSGPVVVVVLGDDALRDPASEWQLLAAGAANVWQFGGDTVVADAVANQLARWQTIEQVLTGPRVAALCVGQSAVWRQLLRQVTEVALYSQAAILLSGESGTGKELVAQLVHQLDSRRVKGPQVIVDCSTLQTELSGSEFFGHEKGAFTGANNCRDGAFAQANNGCLFLDEVAELSPRMQAELLRVVQEGMFKRLGSNQWQQTAFRLVSATHRSLPDEVEAGRFRLDLFYRISACVCHLPPLRDRVEDIPLLAHYFFAQALQSKEVDLSPTLLDYLTNRTYPGNVRELRQLVQRIALRYTGHGPVTTGCIPPSDRVVAAAPAACCATTTAPVAPVLHYFREALNAGRTLKDLKEEAADLAIQVALEESCGSLQQAAARLGVTDRALQIRRASRTIERLDD
jgi:transcriptional regulator with GAF, ATPase, and Fis domain